MPSMHVLGVSSLHVRLCVPRSSVVSSSSAACSSWERADPDRILTCRWMPAASAAAWRCSSWRRCRSGTVPLPWPRGVSLWRSNTLTLSPSVVKLCSRTPRSSTVSSRGSAWAPYRHVYTGLERPCDVQRATPSVPKQPLHPGLTDDEVWGQYTFPL